MTRSSYAKNLSSYFDAMYRASDDPWSVRRRWYEERKRALVLAALPERRYGRGFEPACGNGELTLTLAARCDSLLVSDSTPQAVGLTHGRVRHLSNVRVAHQVLPGDWPAEKFGLIVISELVYFLGTSALQEITACCVASLTDGGSLILCDWKRDFPERVVPSISAHAVFNAAPRLKRLSRYEDDDFLLDVWSPDARSVAQREGFA